MSRSKRKWASQDAKESCDETFPSVTLHRINQNSQASVSSQHNVRNPISTETQRNSHGSISQDMQAQEKMQLVSKVIKYLFAADRGKHPIQKRNIIKNALDGNTKEYRAIIDLVQTQLNMVFGYKLIPIEGNKYILVNELDNHLPHLDFSKDASSKVLLFLVLVHIFMFGESCKEEILWDFLRNLNIITNDSYQHEYFGDVKQFVTVDFINQRYLEKVIIDNDISKVEYKWGIRAENEISPRSALKFVANIYGDESNLKKWQLQYKAVLEQEKAG